MRKITDFIVDHCYIVLILMLILTGGSAFLATKVKINHDIMQYMPADSETAQGLDIMDDEFSDVATSEYSMMFENLEDSKKPEIKEYIENIDGVKSVEWDESNEYNREKDGNDYTLYVISTEGEADGEKAASAYHTIHDHFANQKNEDGSDAYVFYEKGDVSADNGTVLNVAIIVIAVLAALLIITIMSESFIEPILYLISIMLAVVINKGTNIIFPNVSHITDAIAAILQMALSMDYSIMLAHRYRQEREKTKDKKLAMKNALGYSFSSISASSVTTIVGLIVLVFMSFTIGRDMGLVLSKGVLLSLVSIFTTLPAMLLLFDKPIMHSKKKAPRIKMDLLGKFSYHFRKFAFPVFVIIFVASMILKGNVGIEYTSSANDRIKEVFEETNQIAVIYNNDDEQKVSELCHEYEDGKDIKQVLCYGNTIGEKQKAVELKDKAAELGAEMDVDDYLIKTLYYHYYSPDEDNEMSLEEFVDFIQNEILTDDNFSADVSLDTRVQIARLANFVSSAKINQPRSLSELADILEVPAGDLKKIFVLYGNNNADSALGQGVTNTTMTLPEFANFVNKSVLTNPDYSAKVSQDARAKLAQLAPFINKTAINQKSNAKTISTAFGIDQSKVEKIYYYETYLNYMAKNGEAIAKEKAAGEVAAKQKVAELVPQLMAGYGLSQEQATAKATELVSAEVEKQTAAKTAKIEQEIAKQASEFTQSPVDFVDFLLTHRDDEILRGQLDQSTIKSLNLAKQVMSYVNTDKRFSYIELARAFSLDGSQLRLLCSLYYFTNINTNPSLSIKQTVDFINAEILPSPEYSANLSNEKISKLGVITSIMNSALMGQKYTAKSIYATLSPLSSSLDSNLIDLLYMYHGSLYNYNDDWQISLEEFVNYLHDNILEDKRFANKIDDDTRDKVQTAKEKIADAKKLLVGKKYSRAIFNTTLDAEGAETFDFIETLKSAATNKKATTYTIGNSPMALEMSKTFNGEMNFITILTMVSIFIVVAITFKSAIIPTILVLIIQSAVWITMSILSFTGSSVYFIALIIVQAILMGATIDYAILYTSYYLENRGKNLPLKSAIIDSYNKSIHTIITSASVLVIVTFIVGKFDSGSAIAAKICMTVSEGTLCSAILILLILPALLAACDKFIVKRKNGVSKN